MRALVRVIALCVFVCVTVAASVAETPVPPAPSQWVTDSASLLQAQTVAEQNARLRQYEQTSGHQILVYIAPTTGGVPIEDWAVAAFAKWKVGRKGLDDGLVLFIFPKDHALHIEVGYGLEAKVPDVLAGRIIRDTIAPALKANEPDRGVTEGIDKLLALTGNTASPAATSAASSSQSGNQTASDDAPMNMIEIIFIGIGILIFLIILIRSPATALQLLFIILQSGSRGGGGSSGGGGFSGGGGRSGGGGASGTW
jgi:uncharacterized protein